MVKKINRNYTLDVKIINDHRNKNYKIDIGMDELINNSKNTFIHALELYNKGKNHLYDKWDKKNSLSCFSKSKEICDKLIENETEKLDVYIILGDILSIVGDYREAVKVYDLGMGIPVKNDFLYKEKRFQLQEKKSEALKKVT
jgi:tetratricopeptide (TPR) repeat protein